MHNFDNRLIGKVFSHATLGFGLLVQQNNLMMSKCLFILASDNFYTRNPRKMALTLDEDQDL